MIFQDNFRFVYISLDIRINPIYTSLDNKLHYDNISL